MWKPDIHETEEYEITEKHSNKVKLQQRYDKYKDMVLWETANFAKSGDAILYTQSADKDPKSGKGTERGLEWMKSLLTDYHFIEVPAGGHIDGKLALLRPGLLMTWREDFIPKELKSWDKIIVTDNAKYPKEFKNTKKQRFYSEYVMKYLSDWVGYSQETWFDVNCLSVNENTIVTGSPQITLETGATDGVGVYSSGSGGKVLSFNYTVAASDNSPDLDYVSTTALALNGGTMKDMVGLNADLTLPTPGATG